MERFQRPTIGEIKKAQDRKLGDFGNEVLYGLCAKNPGHTIRGVIAAKVNIIGRVYAVSIERGRGPGGDGGDDFFENKVVPTILNEGIDGWFHGLAERSPKLRPNEKDTKLDLETHMKLMALFKKIAKKERRSLASKYLHFHFPTRFYIFDSRAVKGISKFIKAISAGNPRLRGNYDPAYARFYVRCEDLNEVIAETVGYRLTPRELDNLLLARG